MRGGENDMGLRKIIDMTRLISVVILVIHSYLSCYQAFRLWHLTHPVADRVLTNIEKLPIEEGILTPKLIALGFLMISLLGVKGRKDEQAVYKTGIIYLVLGLIIYFISGAAIWLPAEPTQIAYIYMGTTGIGYILILTGGGELTKVIKNKLSKEVSNKRNETFPQEERLLENEYSINLPASYQLKDKIRRSYINFINPRRSLLVLGGPGSGKSFYVVENCIRQMIGKQYALFVFDFKYPDLTALTYNCYLKYRHTYKIPPTFHSVNFSQPEYSSQCNPLFPEMMNELMDAMEASKTMLLSINRTWANKQGEFFVESPINFLAAIFWFLRKYRNGKYCTLPHAIELLQLGYDKLFTVLNSQPAIHTLINPFISAYLSDIMETVESQIASVRIPLGRLASPELYYILSGNDFTMDINNPAAPKIFCLGSDPVKSEALAPVLSLICDRMNKIINRREKMKCGTIYDEFAQIRVPSVQTVISVGRGHNLVCILALQDYSQLKRIYSREEAEAIFNMTGNIISGQVSGETAKMLSERFPKIMQDRQSISINSADTSISNSKQLETSIPASTIASLSSGEFVGLVADNPDEIIELKPFHCRIINDIGKIEKERSRFYPLPIVRKVEPHTIERNYYRIQEDINVIVEEIMEDLLNDPAKEHLIVKK